MKILFITRKSERCGVADYGKRLFDILQSAVDITLCECDAMPDLSGYDIALYNYHYATMPFIDTSNSDVKHIALFHEAHLNQRFDKVIPIESLPRPLMNGYSNCEAPVNTVPVIGSFGFGFHSKDFGRLANMVRYQFENAILRLNIPFAEFGDSNGMLAMEQAYLCKRILGDRLQVTHDYLTRYQLLHWCRQNDLNAFIYLPSSGRGLSSCIDYALSVRRPIAVSESEMFRHLPRTVVLGDLPEILSNGIGPLEEVYAANSNERLVEEIIKILE